MDNQQATQTVTDLELGWIAGIVDGEGWLGMTITQDRRKTRNDKQQDISVRVELKITNCDEEIILKSADILRKMGINPYLRSHNGLGPGRRIVHECATKHMATVERFLIQVKDHLVGIKRERAVLMLRFIESRRNAPAIRVTKPDYPARGRYHGARTYQLRPYSEEELDIIAACRELQSRGASETTREDRDKAVRALRSEHVSRRLAAEQDRRSRYDIVQAPTERWVDGTLF